MISNSLYYEFDPITGLSHPAKYPGEAADKWVIPDDIKNDYSKLNSVIETKYTREFLKICAFYNKMFPSLKTTNWIRSSYNVPPFTVMDQERTDTGTGISSNYLKQIIDQVVSRLGTVTFDPAIIEDVPTLAYVIYKDEVERLLRKMIRDEDWNRIVLEVFHDAAIVGFSHVLIDPFTHKLIKANDYEIGMYESQFNRSDIKQVLYRDYAFPTTSLVPYLEHCDAETTEKIVEEYGKRTTCDFKLYFDCTDHKAHVMIGGTALPPIDYPFDTVQMVTFSWDNGFSRVTVTSLFDLLYPVQREINKVNAKLQQLIRLYKGPVPVFNADVDLSMKAISNGTGEVLYVDSARPIDSLMTVINPTPLDPQLDASKTGYKTEMYELAGIQQLSFDLENMRSAAAVIAMDQTRDTVFQAQLQGIAGFVKSMFRTWVNYNTVVNASKGVEGMEWAEVKELVDGAYIELKPVHLNDPLGNKAETEDHMPPDYEQIQTYRYVKDILRGTMTFEALPYMVNVEQIKMVCATTIVKLSALGIEPPDTIQQFMVAAFVYDVQTGVVPIVGVQPGAAPPEGEGEAVA
jgi:hypothetical protein